MKAMILKWHPLALADLSAIVEYCSTTFGRKTARNVRNKLIYTAELLCANSFIGSVEPLLKGCSQLEYRSLVADSHTKIIYTIHEDYIYIHLLWDVRQSELRMGKMAVNRYAYFEQHLRNTVNEPPPIYGAGANGD